MGIKQRTKSLKSRGTALSDTFYQLQVLANDRPDDAKAEIIGFNDRIKNSLVPNRIEVFQINIGKLCNQSCAHCHVDAGPDRKDEQMTKKNLSRCLNIIDKYNIPKVDITGGAPEMNQHFRWFVEECQKLGVLVMNRCNLTIIEANPRFSDLPHYFARNNVHIISSLPYFSKSRTDSQRGDGVFADSIKALQKLNAVGYGIEGSGLQLDLVYNPSGAFLPGDQASLEKEFKSQLLRRYGIVFNQLYVITNLPISRFLEYLIASDNYKSYMEALANAYNPNTLDGLMCKYTISVSWDGFLYDCDFNQMLNLQIDSPSNHLKNFDIDQLLSRKIVTKNHCYGCTAGAGSSCGGEVI